MSDPSIVPLQVISDQIKHAMRQKRPNRKNRSDRSARLALERLNTDGWPFPAMLISAWFIELLKGVPSLETVNKYRSAIMPAFLSVSADVDLRQMDGDELRDMYEQILLEWPFTRGRNWKVGRVNQFHSFCVQRFGLEPLPESLTNGDNAGLVNARIISEPVFLQMRETVCDQLAQDDEHREALWVYLTLTYRCGLRRAELVKLLRRDIDYGKEIWLQCRDNSHGTTKSRPFKVPALCPALPSERKRIDAYLAARTPTEDTRLSLVFHETGLFDQEWRADVIGRSVSEALAELVPGKSLTLHAGRHTAASRVFLLTFGTEERIAQLTPYSAKHCMGFRETILKSTELGKDDMWCVSAMKGHGSPEVTCRSYVHTAHIALHDQINQMETRWTRNQIRNLAGTTHRVVNRWSKGLDVDEAGIKVCDLDNITLSELEQFGKFVDGNVAKPKRVIIEKPPRPLSMIRPSMDRAIEVLKMIFEPKLRRSRDGKKIRNLTIDEISARTGIPLVRLAVYQDNIGIVTNQTTQQPSRRGNPMLRHVSSAKVAKGVRTPLPRRPKHKVDHSLIPKFFRALRVARKNEPDVFCELCRQYLIRMTTSSSSMPLDSIDQLERLLPILTNHIPVSRWQVVVRLPEGKNGKALLKRWRVQPSLDVVASSLSIAGTSRYPAGKAELRVRSALEKRIVEGQSIVNTFNRESELRAAEKYTSSLLKYCLFYVCVVWLEPWQLRELVGLPPIAGEQALLL